MANSTIVTDIKDKVIKELIRDPNFVAALDAPNINVSNSEQLINTHIFRYNQNPNTLQECDTFITVQVHIPENYYDNRSSDLFVKPILEMWIISHYRHMDITNLPGITDNRNDYLAKLIDLKFNGRRDFGGIGELNLSSNVEGSIYDKYIYRDLKFRTKDFNDSLCGDADD